MYLSDHFTLDEMTTTDRADMADQNKVNAIPFIPTLGRVCLELLEPIRALPPIIAMFPNTRINVHSGYRYKALNDAVGSQDHSQHLVGEAADFDINGARDNDSLVAVLHVIMNSGIKFRQLLIENECLHISLPHGDGNDGQVAYWHNGVKVSLGITV